MDYREKRDMAWKTFKGENDADLGMTLTDFLNFKQPLPAHGDTWGNWQYNAKTMVLTHRPENYGIDLEECTSSAELSDKIFQLCNKVWMNPTEIGHMIQALNDLLRPQATLCSFGQDKKFDPRRHALAFNYKNMPTPEQQREYLRLSGQLGAIGRRHYSELPKGSASLALTVNDGKVLVEAYDNRGNQIGTVPNAATSSVFRSELENAFVRVTLPDENVIAIL
jgi:hypothetical protein